MCVCRFGKKCVEFTKENIDKNDNLFKIRKIFKILGARISFSPADIY